MPTAKDPLDPNPNPAPASLFDSRLKPDDFKPISPRRRLLIVVLSLATAGTVMYSVLERPGLHLTRQVLLGPDGRKLPPVHEDEPPRCSSSQQMDCVGGQAQVIMVAPGAQAGSGAASPSTSPPAGR